MNRLRCRAGAFGLLLMAAVASGQTSTVNGRVVNSKGGVVPDADVSLMNLPSVAPMPNMPNMPMPATPAPVKTGTSGANGAFSLTQVPAGQYILQVDAPGFARSTQEITIPSSQAIAVTLETLDLPGQEATAAQVATDPQALAARIEELEKKVKDLESTTVLSEPQTQTKKIEVYVDKDGHQYDQPTPGAKKVVQYQRERVFRRQNIADKIEEALADQRDKSVSVGVSAATSAQSAVQHDGPDTIANGHSYMLASADVTFTAKVAQNTIFFADLVGITGPPIDNEVGGLELLNSFNSRLVHQNSLDLREAWVRTELYKQRLALTAGRIDLTNYFDRNAVANDEFTQFLSDALVNNEALGLVVNGVGAVGVIDPKNGWAFKAGIQQSNLTITNLSQSLFALAEVDYVARPFSLPEGNYRIWGRRANAGTNLLIDRPQANGYAGGVSIDQKLTDHVTLFGRYGYGRVDVGRMNFASGGFQMQKRFVVNSGDTWSFGYAKSNIPTVGSQNLVEAYYNFRLSERLRLSFHLAHDTERMAGEKPVSYFVPGVRFQVAF
jgi:hypothetical protein